MQEKYKDDPDVERARQESNEVLFEGIRGRIARKQYDKMVSTLVGTEEQELQAAKDKQSFRFVLAFGFGFITLMFLSFIAGYFFGKHILKLDETSSLLLSIAVGTSTIILETCLFIVKMEKMERMERMEEERLKKTK